MKIFKFAFTLACASLSTQAFSREPPAQPREHQVDAKPAQTFQIRFVRGSKVELLRGDTSKSVMFFRAFINGEEIWALLDNGADNSVLDTGLAKKLGLNLVASAESVRTPNSSLATNRVPAITVLVPSQFEFTAPMYTVDLSQVSKLIDRPIGLVLGNDILKNMAYVVDPAYKSLLFMKSGEFGLDSSEHQIQKFPYLDGIVDAQINGKPARLKIDFGSSHSLTVFERSWGKFFAPERGMETTQTSNVSGEVRTQFVTSGVQLNLGSLASKVQVTQALHPEQNIDGHIGFPFFSDKFVVVDESLGQLTIVKRKSD